MELKAIIGNLEDYSASDIVNFLIENNLSFEIFSESVRNKGGWDSAEKRKNVQALLRQKDKELYAAATNQDKLEFYLSRQWCVLHITEAQEKIQSLNNATSAEERKRDVYENMLREIDDNINEYDIDDVSDFDDEVLSNILKMRGYDTRGVDVKKIRDYIEPKLKFNDIPQDESEVPEDYTDVFFWGIPSSGKTCALSAIFSTIKKEYLMESPDCEKKFGATYRDSLINIFRNDCGYLPGRTSTDKTQYMPFLLYKNGERLKRKISFFELSGEVFRYFYEVTYNIKIIPDSEREDIEKSFHTLDLLLKSNNQKIHFFFIDYNQETKNAVDKYQLTQSNYLEAAATYFRDTKHRNGKPVDIFKEKTDAVYVVVTKSDEIREIYIEEIEKKIKEVKDEEKKNIYGDKIKEIGKESDNEIRKNKIRALLADLFLYENFGSFMGVLKNQCENHSVDFNVKIFSIGDVIFKKVCIINRNYSRHIIKTLLAKVNPSNNSAFGRFFNS